MSLTCDMRTTLHILAQLQRTPRGNSDFELAINPQRKTQKSGSHHKPCISRCQPSKSNRREKIHPKDAPQERKGYKSRAKKMIYRKTSTAEHPCWVGSLVFDALRLGILEPGRCAGSWDPRLVVWDPRPTARISTACSVPVPPQRLAC